MGVKNMVITREEVTPSFVANATTKKLLVDGIHKQYEIQALEGYELHDNRLDFTELDIDTMQETTKLGYTKEYVSCRYDYDFTENSFEFYTVLIDKS